MSATQTPKENPVCTHLHKRSNGVYYFRRRVPLELVELFGCREFNESLGTKDRRTAEVACRKRSIATDAIFAKARAMALEEQVTPGPAPAKPMTPEQERAQWEGEQWAIEQAAHDTLFEDEIREEKAQRRAGYRSLMAFADSLGLGLPATDKEALQAIFARRTGQASKAADKPTGKASGLDLDDLVDKWADEKKPAAKTIQRARSVITDFAKTAHVSRAGQVERPHVLKYKDTMLDAGQSPANINNKLIMLSTVFNYAVKNDLGMASNPATGIKATDKRRAREKRLPFDLTALQAIFSSPVYSDHARPLGGGGEASYWLPLIALFSGARIEEIAQLHPDDVYEESYHDAAGKAHSAWVIRFVDNEDEGQQVKTESSVRRIPVHPALIALGFIDEVKAAKAAKRSRLFHKLRPDSAGNESGNYSKWFGRWLREVCKVTDKRMVFHSFRHTFKHLARQAGIPKDVHSAITGHESGETGDDYGGLSYPLAPLMDAMQRYSVPGLTLPTKPRA